MVKVTSFSALSDTAYTALISDLLAQPEVQQLKNYRHHKYSNRLEHCLNVSYRGYLIAKRKGLNYRAVARAGLLHDLFYYTPKTSNLTMHQHLDLHPTIALHNAEKLTTLSAMEEDIILSHMWGETFTHMPQYKESYLICYVDKQQSVRETWQRSRRQLTKWTHKLKTTA